MRDPKNIDSSLKPISELAATLRMKFQYIDEDPKAKDKRSRGMIYYLIYLTTQNRLETWWDIG